MLRIDRTKLSAYEAYQLDRCNENARKRRARNRAAGLCVNENLRGTHGQATHGVRCAACHEQHQRSR